jgi:hypothetical protein
MRDPVYLPKGALLAPRRARLLPHAALPAGRPGGDIINTFADKPATLSLGTASCRPAWSSACSAWRRARAPSFELPPARPSASATRRWCSGSRASCSRRWATPTRATRRRRGAVPLLAEPRGFCAGVDRAIAIVERALAQVRRADLRAPRDRAQHLRRRRPEAPRARSSSRSWPRCRPAPRWSSARTASRKAVRARPRRAASRLRRHLPAGDQGARRGGQDARGGPRVHHDRPQGPSRGRGHDGPVDRAACTWSRRGRTWRAAGARSREARVRDADHAVGRRRARDRRGAEGALSRASRSRSSTTSATPRRTGRTR